MTMFTSVRAVSHDIVLLLYAQVNAAHRLTTHTKLHSKVRRFTPHHIRSSLTPYPRSLSWTIPDRARLVTMHNTDSYNAVAPGTAPLHNSWRTKRLRNRYFVLLISSASIYRYPGPARTIVS